MISSISGRPCPLEIRLPGSRWSPVLCSPYPWNGMEPVPYETLEKPLRSILRLFLEAQAKEDTLCSLMNPITQFLSFQPFETLKALSEVEGH